MGAFESLWITLALVPITEGFSMGAPLPVAIGGPMAFGTEMLDLIVSECRSIMQDQLVAGLQVMAVVASCIDSVIQPLADLLMLEHGKWGGRLRLK